MKITRDTMRADGKTVGEARNEDAAFLRSMGFDAKDDQPTHDEKEEAFIEKVRDAVLTALDNVSPTGQGATDQDLPELFAGIDVHATKLFHRLLSEGKI